MHRINYLSIISILSILLCTFPSQQAFSNNQIHKDWHKDELGFFDIHYCNWPDQKPFLMLVYATHHYKNLDSIKVLTPEGRKLGEINKSTYRYLPAKTVKGENIPDKKVFITHIPFTKNMTKGTFTAVVTTNSGQRHQYKDEVNMDYIVATAKINYPADKATDIPLAPTLKWDTVENAKYYQFFIKDNWSGENVYASKTLNQTQFTLPKDILKKDGWYAWKVHAKDMDETIKYGDFNAGSLSETITFTTVAD